MSPLVPSSPYNRLPTLLVILYVTSFGFEAQLSYSPMGQPMLHVRIPELQHHVLHAQECSIQCFAH